MTAGSDDWGLTEQRNRYQEDTFKWLYDRFRHVSTRIDDRTEWQASEAKEFVQAAAHSLTKTLTYVRDSLILWLALIALVALASAGLWIGVGAVLAILAWRWYTKRSAAALSRHFKRFRNDCFGKLLEIADGRGNPEAQMLEEDKEFVKAYRDTLFYPLTMRPENHKIPNTFDLKRLETLYREHCDWLAHFHPGGIDARLKCGLCAAIERAREHIQGVVSKFEADLEAARQTLIARIDASNLEAVNTRNFLERCHEWQHVHEWDSILNSNDHSLSDALKMLGDREYWTFEQADQVRELARTQVTSSSYIRASLGKHGVQNGDLARSMFEALTKEMETAVKRYGLEKDWRFYDDGQQWLWEGTGSPWHLATRHVIEALRRAFNRHNSETTLRELSSSGAMLRSDFAQLDWLKNYGFDRGMVDRELKVGWEFVRTQEKTPTRKEERRMFEAADLTFSLDAKARERGAPGIIT